jgi:hypothetical protein
MPMDRLLVGAAVVLSGTMAAQLPAQKFVPPPVQSSDLTLRLEPAGRMAAGRNATSPVAAGSSLLLVDQGGEIFRWTGQEIVRILGAADVPAGLKLVGHERIHNVAAAPAGGTVYVMFISSSVPANVPRRQSPRDPDAWSVLYEFAFDGQRLTSPRAVTALQIRTDGHTGGGLAVLPDGSVLFASGDNGDSYEDGREYSQDASVHLSKLVRIDPRTGEASVMALGVRAAQRLVVTGAGRDARVSFVDPGGWVAEELNSFLLRDEFSSQAPINFGWGRAADGRAREGAFYLDKLGNSTGVITGIERDFRAPVASFGRESATFVAVSGPIVGAASFKRITALFGDLVGGQVLGVTGPMADTNQPVFRVSLVDERGGAVTLQALAGGKRPDPRFFTFPDGSAGVLLEATGQFYRLIETVR